MLRCIRSYLRWRQNAGLLVQLSELVLELALLNDRFIIMELCSLLQLQLGLVSKVKHVMPFWLLSGTGMYLNWASR